MADSVTKLLDLIEGLSEPRTEVALNEQFMRCVNLFGFTSFLASARFPDEGPLPLDWVVSTHPTEWSARYFERGYIDIDPVARMGREVLGSYTWSEARRMAAAGGVRMLEEAAHDFNLRDGFVLSVRGPGVYRSGVSLATTKIDCESRDLRLVQIAATYYVTRLEGIMAPRRGPPVSLSERELECLRWVARGKSDWEMAQIMGISQYTAGQHVAKAMGKLGGSTRAHAVALALARRLIEL